MKKTKNKSSAFTLIELMVVITIIAILSSVAIFGLTSIPQKAQDSSHLSTLRDLQISLESYKSLNNTYPAALTDLVPTFVKASEITGSSYAVDPTNKKSYCIHIVGLINKPETQPDMNCTNQRKTWVVCKGPNISSLTTCPGVTSS